MFGKVIYKIRKVQFSWLTVYIYWTHMGKLSSFRVAAI